MFFSSGRYYKTWNIVAAQSRALDSVWLVVIQTHHVMTQVGLIWATSLGGAASGIIPEHAFAVAPKSVPVSSLSNQQHVEDT